MADGNGWEHEATPTTVYQGSQQEGVEHGHEGTDLSLRSVIQWFGAWALTVAVSIVVLWWLFNGWSAFRTRQELLLPVGRFSNQQVLPPEPRVLPNPVDSAAHPNEPMRGPSELERDHRRQEDAQLESAGLQNASGQPTLPPAAVAAAARQPVRGPLANGEVGLRPSEASGGTALENQLAGE
jgi:hypothetical protein